MVLRSDEQANQEQVERDQRFRGNVGKGAAIAASLGTAAVGGPLAARVMPFLNQYIPAGLAMKGIQKVSPKLGAFLKKGQEMGMNVEEGLSFIKDKLGGNKTSQSAKQNDNVIKQYSPELHQFMKDAIAKGRGVLEAGAEAQGDKKFKRIIAMMTKDHKSPWSAILRTAYGEGATKQQAVKGFNDQKKKKGFVEQELERVQRGDPQQAGQQQSQQVGQGGPGQQALMDVLNKINQKLGQ